MPNSLAIISFLRRGFYPAVAYKRPLMIKYTIGVIGLIISGNKLNNIMSDLHYTSSSGRVESY